MKNVFTAKGKQKYKVSLQKCIAVCVCVCVRACVRAYVCLINLIIHYWMLI